MPFSLRALARAARSSIIAIVAAVVAALPALAEPLRLDDVVAIALRDNPAIATAGRRAEALRARPAQVSAWDDPTFSWEAWNFPDSFRIDAADNNIFRLSQKVPFPGKRRLAGEAAAHEADAAGADVRSIRLDVQSAVTRAYADLWLAGERARIYGRDRLLFERSARIAESQYAVGQTQQAEVLQGEVELTHAVIAERTAQLAIDAARAELNALLSRTPDAPLGDPEPPAVHRVDTPLPVLIEQALTSRPELAGQQALIDREQSGVDLAELGYWPDFEFNVSRFVNYQNPDGFGVMAIVSLPLAHFEKYRAAVGEARVRVDGAESALHSLQDGIRRDVAQAYVAVNSAALDYQLAHSTHVPHAEQAVEVSQAAYVSGTVGFGSLLDALRTMQDTHLQHAEAAADYLRGIAALERAIGGPLAAAAAE